MAVQQPRTQPRIFLTLKVLQFVNQLRRRLKPRPQGSSYPSVLGTERCLDLGPKALRSLAKGLPRVELEQRKQLHHASDRVCKARNKQNTKQRLKLKTPGQDGMIQNASDGKVQQMLSSVDEHCPPGSTLSAIASDDGRFLKQSTMKEFEACSLNDTIQSLMALHDAINVLYACRTQYGDEWLVAQGGEAGLNFDENFIANYEHLLLRLRAELIDALSRKVVEALLLGGHDKKQRRLLSWFTEFSDKPRPLSTFPWTIKPSLAVLWGVCWMFYNPTQRQKAQMGNTRVPQTAVLQNVELPAWNPPGSDDYLDYGMALTGTQPRPAAQQQHQLGDRGSAMYRDDLRLRNAAPGIPTDMAAGFGSVRRPSRVSVGQSQRLGLSSDQTTYCPPFPAALHPVNPILNFLPTNSANATLTAFPQQFDASDFDQPWSLPHTSLPQRTTRHLTNGIPSVRVTGSTENEAFAAPQPDFASFDNSIYPPPPSQEPQASSLNILTDFSGFVNQPYTNMGNCPPPESSPTLALQSGRHERTSSINSNANIPTPVSMGGPRSPLLSPANDRRHSTTSSPGPTRPESEDDRFSPEGDDVGSPRRNLAYKRAEEPQRNHDGKMICKYPDCVGQLFDRKCEWSKHMDKHDRPYKCTVKGCEKLQGFTYSGGLLRHEREVHKMHGGTKKALFCPFPDCKRSSGSGFTRKENLAEHVRRVHRRTSMSADLGHLLIARSDSQDGITSHVRRLSEVPYSRIDEGSGDDEAQFGLKRKRISDAGVSETGDDNDLRGEVKRLRRENEEKDARLRQLEAAVMALQQGRR